MGFLVDYLMGDQNWGTINISHLSLEDDALIFYKPKQSQIKALKALLICFEVTSGLKVNFDKS